MKKLTVGVTGPTGSGKSSIRLYFERRGFEVFDSDRAARDIVAPGSPTLAELAEAFGRDIISRDGTLNRELLAHRAFASREKTDLLNSITHPSIGALLMQRVAQAQIRGHHAVIEAPLLYEAGCDKWCDYVIAVLAPEEKRIERIMTRDRLTRAAAMERVRAQADDDYYRRRADVVIYNESDSLALERAAEYVIDELLDKFGRPATEEDY